MANGGGKHWWKEVDTDDKIFIETLEAWNSIISSFVIPFVC